MFCLKNDIPIANGKGQNRESLLYTSKYYPYTLVYTVFLVSLINPSHYCIFIGSGPPWTWNNNAISCTVVSVLMRSTEFLSLIIWYSRNRFYNFPSFSYSSLIEGFHYNLQGRGKARILTFARAWGNRRGIPAHDVVNKAQRYAWQIYGSSGCIYIPRNARSRSNVWPLWP